MTQHEIIISAIERLGGRITTWELLELRIAQYQTRLKELRDRGYPISNSEPIHGQKGNFLYRLTPSVEKNGKISLDASHRSPIGSGAPRELFKQDQLGREVPIIAL